MCELDKAIAALAIAARTGAEPDRPYFLRAHDDLLALRQEILAYDAKLDAAEEAPTGDDYNRLYEMLGMAGVPHEANITPQ